MQTININEHSLAGWAKYAKAFGFVPDPMILRTGEVFLNGASGVRALERTDFDVWQALEQNIGGLIEFFDMLVTRDLIPLINYGDTFDRMKVVAPLDQLLPNRMGQVEIDYNVYNVVKKGALLRLGELETKTLARFGANVVNELHALRYDWRPALSVPDDDPGVQAARKKFENVEEHTLAAAQFLLGGFIFSGFAQASVVTHYVQPKRARFFLGLTSAPEQARMFSADDESVIFHSAAEQVRNTNAQLARADPVPPVLPYLLAQGEPENARVLLDRALAFRESREGAIYRDVVDRIRVDGRDARQVTDAVKKERERAIAFLAPYSQLETEKSRSLEVKLSAETVGIPFGKLSAETSAKLRIPLWLRLWWNDEVPFGGMHKTLRRLWMAAESYSDLARKLKLVWAKS